MSNATEGASGVGTGRRGAILGCGLSGACMCPHGRGQGLENTGGWEGGDSVDRSCHEKCHVTTDPYPASSPTLAPYHSTQAQDPS